MTKARAVSNGAATKGDIVAGSGTNTSATLSVGTNGYALVADSTQTTGLAYKNLVPSQTGNAGTYLTTDGTNTSWGTVSSGAMTLIQTINVAGGSSWTFSSIPQTYKSLKMIGRNLVQTSSTTAVPVLSFQPNGWATGTGTGQNVEYGPSSTTATGFTTSNYNGSTTYFQSGGTATRGSTAASFTSFEWDIPEYTDTDSSGTYWRPSFFRAIANYPNQAIYQNHWFYKKNGPITSILINESNGGQTYAFASGSISLYGIAG